MANLIFSEEETFDRIVEECIMQGVATEEEFHAIIEDVVNDMVSLGELDENQNIEGLMSHFKARFGEFERRAQEA